MIDMIKVQTYHCIPLNLTENNVTKYIYCINYLLFDENVILNVNFNESILAMFNSKSMV